MSQKAHGTSDFPVMQNLRFNVDWGTADKIVNFNRHYAEHKGYLDTVDWIQHLNKEGTTTFYDSVTGKPLFEAPKGRTLEAFIEESRKHGWPSFRDEEVIKENLRELEDSEMVSLTGSHLGHNIPD